MVGFAASGIDFELHYEDAAEDYASVFAGRHTIGVALVERFAAEGIAFAYPVQIGFTADADGTFDFPTPPGLKIGVRPHALIAATASITPSHHHSIDLISG